LLKLLKRIIRTERNKKIVERKRIDMGFKIDLPQKKTRRIVSTFRAIFLPKTSETYVSYIYSRNNNFIFLIVLSSS
jgi:hypothetical protein